MSKEGQKIARHIQFSATQTIHEHIRYIPTNKIPNIKKTEVKTGSQSVTVKLFNLLSQENKIEISELEKLKKLSDSLQNKEAKLKSTLQKAIKKTDLKFLADQVITTGPYEKIIIKNGKPAIVKVQNKKITGTVLYKYSTSDGTIYEVKTESGEIRFWLEEAQCTLQGMKVDITGENGEKLYPKTSCMKYANTIEKVDGKTNEYHISQICSEYASDKSLFQAKNSAYECISRSYTKSQKICEKRNEKGICIKYFQSSGVRYCTKFSIFNGVYQCQRHSIAWPQFFCHDKNKKAYKNPELQCKNKEFLLPTIFASKYMKVDGKKLPEYNTVMYNLYRYEVSCTKTENDETCTTFKKQAKIIKRHDSGPAIYQKRAYLLRAAYRRIRHIQTVGRALQVRSSNGVKVLKESSQILSGSVSELPKKDQELLLKCMVGN